MNLWSIMRFDDGFQCILQDGITKYWWAVLLQVLLHDFTLELHDFILALHTRQVFDEMSGYDFLRD